jgi:hypothetical protein
VVTTRIRGVSGRLQREDDAGLLSSYAAHRAICEAAIEQALDALNTAGDGAVDADNARELGWAWHALDEAYVRLAHLVAREALARRRIALQAR